MFCHIMTVYSVTFCVFLNVILSYIITIMFMLVLIH
nr:MAG TPA: hypothetical protein [Caudoviricetes sp.]